MVDKASIYLLTVSCHIIYIEFDVLETFVICLVNILDYFDILTKHSDIFYVFLFTRWHIV